MMAAGVRTLVNKPETTRKDCRIVQCQHTLRSPGIEFSGRIHTAYFLDPHIRSTTRMLYSVMAAKSTSDELV